MAINNDFYKAINALAAQGTEGTQSIVDYASFMDYGKKATDLSINNDLQNAYMSNLLNRIKKVINDNPIYTGQYMDIVITGGDPGEIVQTIMTTFYDATYNRALEPLVDGTIYTDQFEYMEGKALALYHSKTNAKEFGISIPDVRWKAAFASPEALEQFNREQMNAVLNSIALYAETERMAIVADVINKALGTTVNDSDETVGAMNYDLLKIYNDQNDTTLTTADCLNNNDFTRWTEGVIGDISDLMEKVSVKFNLHGADVTPYPWKTFTPKEYQRLKINSLYAKAIRKSNMDAYHTEEWKLPDVSTEKVPYWQNEDLRLQVEVGPASAEDDEPTYGDPVIAVLFDKRRCLQSIQMDDVASARENRKKYTSYFWQTASMFYANEYANAVVFTIKGGSV